MAEAVGLAASIIAILELSAKVGTLCFQYSKAVGNARTDIERFQSRLKELNVYLEAAERLLKNPRNSALVTSRSLVDSLDGCKSQLASVQDKLDPANTRKAFRRFRALKWPFSSKEISAIVSSLDQYQKTITDHLQIDQTTILLDIQQKFENVSLQPRGQTEGVRKPYFNVPFDRDPDFVGRSEMTDWLNAKYSSSVGRMALVGMGGFGKSQVAIQFSHNIHEESSQTSVFWIHASSQPRFEEAYRAIAETMNLPKRNDPNVDILALVRDWLETDESGSWLMIVDNADDFKIFYPASNEERQLAEYLPKYRNNTILITSRSLDVAERLTGSYKNIFQVSTLDQSQGLELLRNKLVGDFQHDTAAELLRALDCIPLAITQAAAYINRRAPRESVESYLEAFQKSDHNKSSLLNRDAGDLRRDEKVSNSVITTWQVTFEQISREKPSAANLLIFMSLFNPHGIPEFALYNYNGYLDKFSEEYLNFDGFEDDLDVLRSYSLVAMTATRGFLEMHAMVQTCARAWISGLGDIERWRHLFLLTIMDNFVEDGFSIRATCPILLPHLDSIAKEPPPNKDAQVWVEFMTKYATYMRETGRLEAAEELGKKAVESSAAILGEEHRTTLRSLCVLSMVYSYQGRKAESEKLQLRLLETAKRKFGEEDHDTLYILTNLALMYHQVKRHDEAETILLRALETQRRVLGEKHPLTAISINTLGAIYVDLQDYGKAESLLTQILPIQIMTWGERHFDTIRTMNNLAWVYKEQKRLVEARELLKKALTSATGLLEEEQPVMMNIRLSICFNSLEINYKPEEAIEQLRYCLDIHRKVYGGDHAQTLYVSQCLAFWEQKVSHLAGPTSPRRR